MIEFLYFTFGILFVSFALPLLDGVLALLLSWLEAFKGRASLSVAKCNQQIKTLSEDDIETNSHVIGFQLPTEDDVEEYYEEEEDDE